jgi:hypothetical protein
MKKPELKFKIDDVIVRSGLKGINSQELIIDFIDYTREVYIFKKEWINSFTKFKSLHFNKVHEMFELKK